MLDLSQIGKVFAIMNAIACELLCSPFQHITYVCIFTAILLPVIFIGISTNPTDCEQNCRRNSIRIVDVPIRFRIRAFLYHWCWRLILNVQCYQGQIHGIHFICWFSFHFQYCNDNFISFLFYLFRLAKLKWLQTLSLTKHITNILQFCFVSSSFCECVCTIYSVWSLVFIAFFSLISCANLS